MRFLKVLAIAYLVWAVLYSVVDGRFWVQDALAFKFNGGPQLVAQLKKDGFVVFQPQIREETKFSALFLSNGSIKDGQLNYYWGDDAKKKALATYKAYGKDLLKPSEQTVKAGRRWAIWAGLNESPGAKFLTIKKTVDRLTVNPDKQIWYPVPELRFYLASVLSKVDEGRGMISEFTALPVILMRLVLFFPVLIPFAFSVAFSPPQAASVTAYLPILIYGLLIFLLSRGLFKK